MLVIRTTHPINVYILVKYLPTSSHTRHLEKYQHGDNCKIETYLALRLYIMWSQSSQRTHEAQSCMPLRSVGTGTYCCSCLQRDKETTHQPKHKLSFKM